MAQFRKDTHQYLPQETTIFEVMMLADQYGNLVGPANPSGMAVDAFGRARVSQPFTLFDSQHRYRDNGKWETSNTSNTTYTFGANTGMMDLAVSAAANDEIIRETSLVFAYQPGKSLQILNTFLLNPAKTNLRQRVGYYGVQNGIYLELDDDTLYWVERSNVTDSVQNNRIAQADWNVDKLDGLGPSRLTLDISKAQIMFVDLEWLGLGTVRCGFVINGQYIHTHSFHHANITEGTYITTACLPLRYEIKNKAATTSNSTMKQVCSTVLSEGGYSLRGEQRAIGNPVNTAIDLTTAGVQYPLVSIRLKQENLDAIVIPSAISILPIGNNARIAWRLVEGATVTGGTWVSSANNSSVEYNITANAMSGGLTISQGFAVSTTQSATPFILPGSDFFKYQLERNTFTGLTRTFTLAAVSAVSGDDAIASVDWEEVTL